MVNHPNRKRIYPDHTFEDAARERGANVRVLWEIKGPPVSEVAWMAFYQINGSCALVQTYKNEGGWNVFTPGRTNDISESVKDALNRCGVR